MSHSVGFTGINLGPFRLSQPLGIGTMQWGTTSIDRKVNRDGVLPDEQIDELVSYSLDQKIQFIDSAEGYGGGTSEIRVKEVLHRMKKLRGEIPETIVATKFLPTIWRYTRSSFFRAVRNCAKRLGVDCIDLFFIHSPVHPLKLEFWVQCAADAANQGLIKAIGLSNFNAEQVLRAHKVAQASGQQIAANQIMFSLLDYKSLKLQETERMCQDLGITVIGYASIGQGLLTDQLTRERFEDGSIRAVRMTGCSWEELQPLRGKLEEIAQARGKTMAQVAMNWVISKGHIPLVGCKKRRHAEESVGALDFRLTAAEVAALDALALPYSTLEKPRWRRQLFVVIISVLIAAYRVERLGARLARAVCFWRRGGSGGGAGGRWAAAASPRVAVAAGDGDGAGGDNNSSSTNSDNNNNNTAGKNRKNSPQNYPVICYK